MTKRRPPPLSSEQRRLRQAATDAQSQAKALGDALRREPADATTPGKEQEMLRLFRLHVDLEAQADALADHERNTQGRAGRMAALLVMAGFVLVLLWRISSLSD